mmetsp:Transcript_19626/g.39782  ORF Transcript_19626/g.39782 Transcript_19626/m.39782 type:complete len:152 (+) Transcript_19626:332-787(+)
MRVDQLDIPAHSVPWREGKGGAYKVTWGKEMPVFIIRFSLSCNLMGASFSKRLLETLPPSSHCFPQLQNSLWHCLAPLSPQPFDPTIALSSLHNHSDNNARRMQIEMTPSQITPSRRKTPGGGRSPSPPSPQRTTASHLPRQSEVGLDPPG